MLCLLYHPNLETRQVPKFRLAKPANFEVISAHLFHFKPTFDPSFEKNWMGAFVSQKLGVKRRSSNFKNKVSS